VAEKQLEAARAAEKQAREAIAVSVQTAPPGVAVTVEEPRARLAEATQARIAAEQALLQAQAERAEALAPYQQRFEGKVTRITTEPAGPLGGQRYVSIIEFQNTQGLVKPGMTASVSVRVAEARNVLAVPSGAVHRDKTGRPVVEVLRNGRWERVVVEPGLSDGRYTAIRSGLNDGETVKVTPALL
jgi:multidrug efflux pump subunit AcrA (membrane-fusion protein)